MRGALFIMRISREIFNEGKSSPVLKIKNAYAKGLTVAHDELRSYSHNVWKKIKQTNKQKCLRYQNLEDFCPANC